MGPQHIVLFLYDETDVCLCVVVNRQLLTAST